VPDPLREEKTMQYVKLGRTGLEVSRLCLGAMSFGEPARGNHPWSLPELESREIVRRALDAGINFFDTANVYSAGSSEEILGRALAEFGHREEVVIATKVFSRMRPGPNCAGLSRKAIMAEIDASLSRLGTDYVDIFQIHRWDSNTPIEETMEALHDVVKAGKARYLGASSMFAWQFAKGLYVSEMHGWSRFVSMQNLYNLLYREEEHEMLPFCANEGIGVLCYSPLARGYLSRKVGTQTARSKTDDFLKSHYPHRGADDQIIDAVGRIAAARAVSRASIALAWLLSKPVVTAPIVGATKVEHLDDAISALDLSLTPDEIAALETPYQPRAIAGHD
jgi:aryl-alcohol dehydrogenase-like predicted oxidoreductase